MGRAVTDSSDQLVSCNQQHTHPPATAETALEKVNWLKVNWLKPLVIGSAPVREGT